METSNLATAVPKIKSNMAAKIGFEQIISIQLQHDLMTGRHTELVCMASPVEISNPAAATSPMISVQILGVTYKSGSVVHNFCRKEVAQDCKK
uniref:Uncharacterized protein n=1 Tax=Gibberella zeae TaxID=5518 RepID=A0A4E9EP09_GIBZA